LDFDRNATSPLDPAVREAMLEALTVALGNPSSVHGLGQTTRRLVDRARQQVADALGVAAGEIVFTSGATEANVLAWRGVLGHGKNGSAAVTTAVEHPSVRAVAAQLAGEGVAVASVGVDAEGRLRLPELAETLQGSAPGLLSLMAANNETGVLFPVATAAALGRQAGATVHADLTQALGRIHVTPKTWDLDLASLSGHKLGATPGVGALWVRRGVRLRALLPGHQELGQRAGTENVLGIIGLGAAMAALPQRLARAGEVRRLRDRLWSGLQARVPGVLRNGDVSADLETGNTLNVSFAEVDGATLLMALDLEDVLVSAGSACSSGSLEPSHVLLAMHGESPEGRARARSALRFSLGLDHTDGQVDRLLDLLPALVARVRRAAVGGRTPA
jgi:cysteine desulfurase